MSVTLTIPTALLRVPSVADAVEEFIFVLARLPAAEAPEAPEAAAPAPAPRPVAAPRPAAAPRAVVLPPPAPRASRRAPPPAAPAPRVAESFEAFQAALPETSRRFLELVRERGTVGVADAIAALGLANAKAVGGITGAIGRWAPARGVTLPYEILTLNGERAWRWLGSEAHEPSKAAPAPVERPIAEARPVPTKPAPAKPARVVAEKPPRPRLVKPTPPPAPVVEEEPPAPTLDDVYPTLSELARKLIDAVRKGGSISKQDAVNALGLSRAGALTPLIVEIKAATDPLGLKFFQDTVDYRGVNVYEWASPVAPAAAAPGAPGAPASDEADREFATDGVIRRRRKTS